MFDELAVREAQLQIDFPACLFEKSFTVGRSSLLDAGLLGGNFFLPSRRERREFAGQRRKLLLKRGELCGGCRLQFCCGHQIVANLLVARCQVRSRRLAKEVIEHAEEHSRVEEPRNRPPDCLDVGRTLGGLVLRSCRSLSMRLGRRLRRDESRAHQEGERENNGAKQCGAHISGLRNLATEDAHDDVVGKTLTLQLKYGPSRERSIAGLRRVSKPGLRVYAKSTALPRVLGGLGIAILSTSSGLLTDRQAAQKGVGGEVLAYVW